MEQGQTDRIQNGGFTRARWPGNSEQSVFSKRRLCEIQLPTAFE